MAYKSSSRGSAVIDLFAVHTAEGAKTVWSLASYFNREDVTGSAHAAIDADETLAMVSDYRAAHTLRSGNPRSLNVELCGFAEMTRAQWLSETDVSFFRSTGGARVTVKRPRQMLRRLSAYLAEKHLQHGFRLVKLTPLDVARGLGGVIGHVDWTVGKKDGTHTDPGDGFPWDVVLVDAKAIAYPAPAASGPPKEDDMITVTVPRTIPPPIAEQVAGVDYSHRVDVPLPPSEKGWECSIQGASVANIAHWYWTEVHADGTLTTPAMDQLTTNKMGPGRFDLQPAVRHAYRGHPNHTGVSLRVFRCEQPVTMVLREIR